MKAANPSHQVVKRIVEAIKEKYQPERIILFGSYSSGEPREDSDIDLLIIKNTNKPFYERLAEVRSIVSDVRRGHSFDPLVVTPTELKARLARGDQFFEEILSTGSILYASR